MIDLLALLGMILLAGAAGAVTTRYLDYRRHGRRVVALEPGQRVAEPDGREWRIVSRSIDVRPGQRPSLTVDLVLAGDPS